MRAVLAAAALAAVVSSAPAASASPTGLAPASVSFDTEVGMRTRLRDGPAPLRLYGYRIAGGYSTTVYDTVYVPGSVRHVDAFGRVHRHAGRYVQRPRTVWVPHTVVYPRSCWRGDGTAISATVLEHARTR